VDRGIGVELFDAGEDLCFRDGLFKLDKLTINA
jgi:hypothetical protein